MNSKSNPVLTCVTTDLLQGIIKTELQAAGEAEKARELRSNSSAPGEFFVLECPPRKMKLQLHVLLHALDLPKDFWFKVHPQTDGPRDPRLHWLATVDLDSPHNIVLELTAPLSDGSRQVVVNQLNRLPRIKGVCIVGLFHVVQTNQG